MDPENLPMNPNSFKSRFTRNFLKSLSRINRQTPTSSPSREITRRCRMVKIAADKSMARAVGTRRFWSRAMLCRMRNQTRPKGWVKKIKIDAFSRRKYGKTKNINNYDDNMNRINKKKKKKNEEGIVWGEADELRKLVPGGEAMDFGSLLSETANYLKCLTTQVDVMRSIVHLYSA